MRKLFVLTGFLIAMSLFSSSLKIRLIFENKIEMPEMFKEVIKNNISDYGYELISGSDDIIEGAIEEDNEASKNSDLVMIVKTDKIINYNYSRYKIKIVLKNLHDGEVFRKVFFYKGKTSDEDVFGAFTEKMMIKFFEALEKEKKRKKEEEFKKLPVTPSKKDIMNMVRNIYEDLKDCADAFEYSGELKVRFIIKSDGVVKNVKILKNKNEELKKCLTDNLLKMRTVKFRKKELIVNFPLKFKKKETKKEVKEKTEEKAKKYEEIY